MVPLTATQARALSAVRAAWPATDVVLIGALALGHHIPMAYRATDDLDLAMAVPFEDFPGPLTDLPGWKRHPKLEHRFFTDDGQMVDVLPVGDDLIAAGHIQWRDGHRMSLVGFDLAFMHNTQEPAGTTTVLVPTAPVIAFLKMRAWLDRPENRKKDLPYIAYLLCEYIGDVDDGRRWADDLVALDLEYQLVSPYALGRDLGRITTVVHKPHIAKFLTRATPERLAAQGPASWHSADDAEAALSAFRQGLES